MNRKRIFAIGKLVVLFGTPVALILGLFSCGVYCGVDNRAGIARFEKDWLGLDVEVPDEPEARAKDGEAEPEGREPEAKADTKEPEAKVDTKEPETKAPPPEAKTPETKAVVPSTAPPTEPPSTTPGGVPAPLPPPETRVDPLDDEQAGRMRVPVVAHVKVLVDQSLIDDREDWIDYVQRTVSRASHIYERQFGVELQLVSVGRWSVALEGMSADDLLADLKSHAREGADLLVGFTSRPFDDTTSGTADTPPAGSPFNGAYGVVYATPGHREAHLRTLLHEVGHMFGAKDIVDPAHPGWKAGSWMSYARVPETQAPWIDPNNRQRVLDRKDMPFSPEPAPAVVEPLPPNP